jgi:hypothetical protein
MKKTLAALCVAALSTGGWLSPAAAAVVATSDLRFLAGRRRKAPVSSHDAGPVNFQAAPLDEILKKAQAEATAKATVEAATVGYQLGGTVETLCDAVAGIWCPATLMKINADGSFNLKKLSDGLVLQNVKMDPSQVRTYVPPAPMPAPAPAPAPAPLPAPAPMPMPDPPPPIPPCNWTYDWEDVARPADCLNMSDGNHTCVRDVNLTFGDDDMTCVRPVVNRCLNPTLAEQTGGITGAVAGPGGGFPMSWNGERYEALYAIAEDSPISAEESFKHGIEFPITCAENATAVDHRYELESWGQDWYPGRKTATGVCNNGTIIRMDMTNQTEYPGHPFYKPPGVSPTGLRCVLKEKVSLTQDIISYLRWSEPRMQEAETRGYKWIDMDGLLHKKLLKDFMAESSALELAARDLGQLREILDLRRIRKGLIEQRMIPRGEPMSQETCKDLEKHWLYELKNSDPFKKANMIGYANWVPPTNATIGYPTKDDIALKRSVGFTCSYTLHKAGAGADPITNVMSWRYRDGCYCESRWSGGCPFRAELTPSYKTFGFDSIETKSVSTAIGAPTNALCWYFTKPANPEWGYLRTGADYPFSKGPDEKDTGPWYQAPASNVTELKRDWIKLRKLAQKARFKRR